MVSPDLSVMLASKRTEPPSKPLSPPKSGVEHITATKTSSSSVQSGPVTTALYVPTVVAVYVVPVAFHSGVPLPSLYQAIVSPS